MLVDGESVRLYIYSVGERSEVRRKNSEEGLGDIRTRVTRRRHRGCGESSDYAAHSPGDLRRCSSKVPRVLAPLFIQFLSLPNLSSVRLCMHV